MSGSDGFLARWARRKQAVKDAAPSSPSWGEAESERSSEPGEGTASDAGTPPPHPLGSRRVGLSLEGRGEDPAADSEQLLPPVEEIDAASDITGFLREGVPEALRQAALRRVWALDPAIRDFVGPAEYAWDFNDPGSMAGFSGAVSTPDLAGFFSGQPGPPQVPARSITRAEHDDSAIGGDAAPEGQPLDASAPPEEPILALVPLPPAADEELSPAKATAADRGGKQALSAPSEASDFLPRRHGGALPR